MLTLKHVTTNGDEIDTIRTLFGEYSDGLNENLSFQSFDEELQDPLKKYGPPNGSLFLGLWNSEAAGCIALQPIAEQGVCEMKRLYVRPEYRKHGIGAELIKVLLKEAKQKGYKKMVLDTLERLQPAIKLYQEFGFENTSAYYENPLPNVVYMEKIL